MAKNCRPDEIVHAVSVWSFMASHGFFILRAGSGTVTYVKKAGAAQVFAHLPGGCEAGELYADNDDHTNFFCQLNCPPGPSLGFQLNQRFLRADVAHTIVTTGALAHLNMADVDERLREFELGFRMALYTFCNSPVRCVKNLDQFVLSEPLGLHNPACTEGRRPRTARR